MRPEEEIHGARTPEDAAIDGPKVKARLVEALEETEAGLISLQRSALKFAEFAQRRRDLAGSLKLYVQGEPSADAFASPAWEYAAAEWRRQNSEAQKVAVNFEMLGNSLLMGTATVVTSTGTALASSVLAPVVTYSRTETARAHLEQLEATLRRLAPDGPLSAAMRRFGMDRGQPGARSPLEQLEEARAAFRSPSRLEPAPAAVLVPAREAIHAAIDHLLKRLPPPQAAAGTTQRKIALIGERCAKPGLDARHFEGLGTNAKRILDALSGAKGRKLDRTDIAFALDSAVALIAELLESVDSTKLRDIP